MARARRVRARVERRIGAPPQREDGRVDGRGIHFAREHEVERAQVRARGYELAEEARTDGVQQAEVAGERAVVVESAVAATQIVEAGKRRFGARDYVGEVDGFAMRARIGEHGRGFDELADAALREPDEAGRAHEAHVGLAGQRGIGPIARRRGAGERRTPGSYERRARDRHCRRSTRTPPPECSARGSSRTSARRLYKTRTARSQPSTLRAYRLVQGHLAATVPHHVRREHAESLSPMACSLRRSASCSRAPASMPRSPPMPQRPKKSPPPHRPTSCSWTSSCRVRAACRS